MNFYLLLLLIVPAFGLFNPTSQSGDQCTTACELETPGSSCFSCKTTANKTECCSPKDQTTIKGISCVENHSCDFHGYKYKWCWTSSKGDWEKCTSDENCLKKHYCGKHGYSYNYCYTDAKWDYCSITTSDKSCPVPPKGKSICKIHSDCTQTGCSANKICCPNSCGGTKCVSV